MHLRKKLLTTAMTHRADSERRKDSCAFRELITNWELSESVAMRSRGKTAWSMITESLRGAQNPSCRQVKASLVWGTHLHARSILSIHLSNLVVSDINHLSSSPELDLFSWMFSQMRTNARLQSSFQDLPPLLNKRNSNRSDTRMKSPVHGSSNVVTSPSSLSTVYRGGFEHYNIKRVPSYVLKIHNYIFNFP